MVTRRRQGNRLLDWQPEMFTAANLKSVTKRELVGFLQETRLSPPTPFHGKQKEWLIEQVMEDMSCADCATPIPFEVNERLCEACATKREEHE